MEPSAKPSHMVVATWPGPGKRVEFQTPALARIAQITIKAAKNARRRMLVIIILQFLGGDLLVSEPHGDRNPLCDSGDVDVVDAAWADDIDGHDRLDGASLLGRFGAALEKYDAVTEGDGFADVVGDEENGGGSALPDPLELNVHVLAGLSVKCGE